jgi:hypothetical protein
MQDGVLYVWSGTEWLTLGELEGPQGPQGPIGPQGEQGEGLQINGSGPLPGTGDFVGQVWMYDGHLYVWDGMQWDDEGTLKGEQGDPGEQGEPGEPGPASSITAGANVYVGYNADNHEYTINVADATEIVAGVLPIMSEAELELDLEELADIDDKIMTPKKTLALFEWYEINHPSPPPDWSFPGDGEIIGVVDTGARSSNGGGLQLVDFEGNPVVGYDTAKFNTLWPWSGMIDYISGQNFMVKLPRFWQKRDVQPAGKVYAGNQRWMISPGPDEEKGFVSDGAVFKDSNGNWCQEILIGKYRASNNGSNVVVSTGGGTRWADISFNDLKSACEANGQGYHLMSCQEWYAIMWLAVIEEQTWTPFNRRYLESSYYRGINEFSYGPNDENINCEFFDGIKSEGGYLELFKQDGSREYDSTGLTPPSNNYITALHYGDQLDKYFIPAEVGLISNAIIPSSFSYNDGGEMALINFNYYAVNLGPFALQIFGSRDDTSDQHLGGRLAKV